MSGRLARPKRRRRRRKRRAHRPPFAWIGLDWIGSLYKHVVIAALRKEGRKEKEAKGAACMHVRGGEE